MGPGSGFYDLRTRRWAGHWRRRPDAVPRPGEESGGGGVSLKETRLGVTADHRPMASWIPWQKNERYEREIPPGKKSILEVPPPPSLILDPWFLCWVMEGILKGVGWWVKECHLHTRRATEPPRLYVPSGRLLGSPAPCSWKGDARQHLF